MHPARGDHTGVANIERFLSDVTAAECFAIKDAAAVVDALDHLPMSRAASLVERIVAATAAPALAACANLVRRLVTDRAPAWSGHLSASAIKLVEALPGDPDRPAVAETWRTRRVVDHALVVDLVTGLGAIDASLCRRAIAHFLAWPRTYDMDSVLIPALRQLVASGSARDETIEPLRAACLAHLRARIAEPLAPPADWSRSDKLGCACARCQGLARILADPAVSTWVFKAAAADRGHVEDTIRHAHCDLDTRTETRGRPYSLVCDKNQASDERRAKQRKQDLSDLARFAA